MISITEFIKQHDLGKYKISGDQIEIGCPFKDCPNHGKPQFYISLKTGAWFCHRCNKKGMNLKRLEFALGFVTLQDPIKSSHIYVPEKDLKKYEADLIANEDASSYLSHTRSLSKGVVRQFRLGYKELDGQPVIIIPYFDVHGVCVGMKYDFFKRPAGSEKYRKEKGTKTQAYNLQYVDLNQPLVVTEGEYDAMSAFQYGYENVISMPNGSGGVNGWIEDIKDGTKYLLAVDNDGAGEEGSKKLGEVLGLSKCFRVYPRCKDMNSALQLGLDKKEIDKWFKDCEPMFHAPVTDITNYTDKAIAHIEDPKLNKGISTGWDVFDSYLGGIRPKEVTVVSGKSGNGKTTFSMALIGNLIKQGKKCLVISPEMKEERLLIELANNHFNRQATKEELIYFVENNKGLVQLANVYGSWTDEKQHTLMSLLFNLIEYSCKHFGTEFVFIDHLRLFTSVKEDKERSDIDEFMKKCVRISMLNNCHLWLVVQPRKLAIGQRKVTRGDLKGSGNIEQDAHNIVLIHREENSELVEFDVTKNRELGTEGMFHLRFNKESLSNYLEVKDE